MWGSTSGADSGGVQKRHEQRNDRDHSLPRPPHRPDRARGPLPAAPPPSQRLVSRDRATHAGADLARGEQPGPHALSKTARTVSSTALALSAEYARIPRMPLSTGPLIGRDTDLSHLADAIGLRPTPGAQPDGVVVLSGYAGIGKSRLVGQLVTEARDAGWFTAVGHCVGQAGRSHAYLPFVELVVARYAGHPEVV